MWRCWTLSPEPFQNVTSQLRPITGSRLQLLQDKRFGPHRRGVCDAAREGDRQVLSHKSLSISVQSPPAPLGAMRPPCGTVARIASGRLLARGERVLGRDLSWVMALFSMGFEEGARGHLLRQSVEGETDSSVLFNLVMDMQQSCCQSSDTLSESLVSQSAIPRSSHAEDPLDVANGNDRFGHHTSCSGKLTSATNRVI